MSFEFEFNNGFGLVPPVSCASSIEGKLAWERGFPETLRCYYRTLDTLASCWRESGSGTRGSASRVVEVGAESVGGDVGCTINRIDSDRDGVFLQSEAVGVGGDSLFGDEGTVCGGNVTKPCQSCGHDVGRCGAISRTEKSTGEPIDDAGVAGDNDVFSSNRDKLLNKIDVQNKEQVVDGKIGVNTLRNRANRAAQRDRKLKRKSMNQDWRKKEVVVKKRVGGDDEPSGFWNSCDESVRRELINSKARMHIAENKRREQEASDKYDEMTSAYGTMKRCVQMAEFAQKQAVKEKDGKIYGWANTVASSSAESLARSAPSSVPSFDELSAKLEASSQSSYEAELQAKIEEFKEECRVDKLKSAILAEDAKQALERLKIDNVVDEKKKEQAQKVKDQKDKAIHDQLIAKIKYLENEMIGYREPTTINLRNHRYARGF